MNNYISNDKQNINNKIQNNTKKILEKSKRNKEILIIIVKKDIK